MTEKKIATYLAMHYFKGRHLVSVPNCHWAAGHEADLLLINKDLKAIDYEIKISRSDFKADAKKSKWQQITGSRWVGDNKFGQREYDTVQLQHPKNIWKHYFVIPASVWCDSLIENMPSPLSGVLLVDEYEGRITGIRTLRRARANKEYVPLTNHQLIDVARLASLRMWSIMEKMK